MTAAQEIRPFAELANSGLLWLINRSTFHPRGFALSMSTDDAGNATGWTLLGDGTEPWMFGTDEIEKFDATEATFRAARYATKRKGEA